LGKGNLTDTSNQLRELTKQKPQRLLSKLSPVYNGYTMQKEGGRTRERHRKLKELL